MTKTLQKYLTIFTVVLLAANVAFAQVERGKSRLDIGKKQTNKLSLQTPQLQRFVVPKSMLQDVKINKPAVVNQFFRSNLLSKSSSGKATMAEVAAKNNEANSVENIPSNDKLYASERITVSNIYPNPANNEATVDYVISNNVSSASLTFSNLLGSEVGSFELDKYDNKLKVQTSNWETGIYFYGLVVDGKKIITKKLIVRHN